MKWFRIEKQLGRSPFLLNIEGGGILNTLISDSLSFHPNDGIFTPNIMYQYMYVLILCLFGINSSKFLFIPNFFLETISWHIGIRLSIYLYDMFMPSDRTKYEYNQISMGLVLSSFGKFLPIVTIIWSYYNPKKSSSINEIEYHAFAVGVFSSTSNLEALSGKIIFKI